MVERQKLNAPRLLGATILDRVQERVDPGCARQDFLFK